MGKEHISSARILVPCPTLSLDIYHETLSNTNLFSIFNIFLRYAVVYFTMRWDKRFAALSAVAAMLCAFACGAPNPAPAATPTPSPVPQHRDVSLADMAYERPDIARMETMLTQLGEDIASGADAHRLLADYDAVCRLYRDAESQMALAYLLYAFDVTEDFYQAEYADLSNALHALDIAMSDVSIALFESSDEARALAKTRYGERYIELVYEGVKLNNASVQALFEQEQALILQYDELMATFSVTDGGTDWTYERIMDNDALTYHEFRRLYDAYSAALNRAAGEIFRELLTVRTDIAAKLGYSSFAAYRYDCYGRDYTVTDAKALCEAVKQHIVPLYGEAIRSERIDFALYEATFDQTRFLLKLKDAAADFSDRLGEAYDYMLRNGLYDLSVSEQKLEGSFTTYLANYRAPYIFSQWSGSYGDIGTVIHELGHFANYYHNDTSGWSMGDSLDLAEVDSQALQLLMTPHYPAFFGDLAEAAEQELLLDCLYALISGCMEDEFQRLLYADADMSLEQINTLYRRLAEEYGFGTPFDYTGTEWVLIPHTFRTPMYYISYAVSVVPALELWERMQTDAEAARQAYFNILDRAQFAPFRRTLAENGLTDVFSEQTVKRLADMLEKEF